MGDETTTTTDDLRVIELRAENFKVLQAIHVKPPRNVVSVSGPNNSGKSTTLDAIAAVIGGERLCPDVPIREGEESAQILVDLGRIKVERRWTRKGSRLVMMDGDGNELRSPQKILNQLFDALAFDITKFDRMTPAEQRAELSKMLGLDEQLAAFDQQKRKALDEKAEAKRQVAACDARLPELKSAAQGAPERPVNVDAIKAEIDAANRQLSTNAAMANALHEATVKLEAAKARRASCERGVDELRAQLEKAQHDLEQADKHLAAAQENVNVAEEKSRTLPTVDVSALQNKLADAVQSNAAFEKLTALNKEQERRRKAAAEEHRHDSELKQIESLRQKALRDAAFPIEGLSFGLDGLNWNGLPLKQASASERLRVMAAVAIARKPQLKVLLIRDASLLDEASMEELHKIVREKDWQAWIERVADGPGGVVIEGALDDA